MNKDRILEILESAKDKNDDVPMNLVRKAFDKLPSAEPDLQPTCNQLATDCISRQAAIDASLEFFVEYLGGAFDENSQSRRRREKPSRFTSGVFSKGN